jgi:hypothetical protein
MFDSTLNTIRQAYSGDVAKRHVAAISQYHRIQASPGYREAANYVRAQLHAAGLSTEVLSFPADDESRFWTMHSFQEWTCAKATLDLVRSGQPVERLCSYQATPISLIQRSAPVDGVFDVVELQDGTEDSHYEGIDVAGKLVLTDGKLPRVYDLAVRRRGAAGILFDGMSESAPGRGPLDLPDGRQYTSFWWGPEEPKCFGFVLTPRQGRQLRADLPLQVRAHVVSSFYDGTFEVVTACIPGQTDAEVLVVSHLCHPQPSANDNASGAAANIEVAATLRRLISEGHLPPPTRSIRFLWMPEMTGTYAYLASFEERLPRMLAGVNLDMVGEDHARCHSVFTIERPPEAMASFAPVLLKQLWDQLVGETSPEAAQATTVRHQVSAFKGGSDHFILSDPTVGVPTPMLNQWPDRFYHTSEDTLDKVDPAMLALVGSLAATYAYVVATAGETEATWLGHAIVTRRERRLARRAQDAITRALQANKAQDLGPLLAELQLAIAHRVDRDLAALHSLRGLWPDAGELVEELSHMIEQSARRETERAATVVRHRAQALGASQLPNSPPDDDEPWRSKATGLIPERLYRGPVGFRSLVQDGTAEERDALWEAQKKGGRDWSTVQALSEYWADGQRSIAEIADRVALETGTNHGPVILAFFHLLAAKGLATLHQTAPAPEGASVP